MTVQSTIDILVYLSNVSHLATSLDIKSLEKLIDHLTALRTRNGTLYIVGLGGSAANASHMSADFRKLCAIDARSLDNIAEITARANDEGWETIFDGFLGKMGKEDALLVLSVGGGTGTVSTPLVRAVNKAKAAGTTVLGIVGPNGGHTGTLGDCVIKIPCKENQTPHTESFQVVVSHLLVSHPLLQKVPTKWV